MRVRVLLPMHSGPTGSVLGVAADRPLMRAPRTHLMHMHRIRQR